MLYQLSYVGGRTASPTTEPLERVMGIEPTSSAWKAEVLPLNYTRADGTAVRRLSRSPVRFRLGWWRGKDSNLRRHKPADLQSAPVGRLGTPPANEPRIFGPKSSRVNVFRAVSVSSGGPGGAFAQRPEIRPWPGERPSGSRGTSAGLAATRRQVREVGFAAAEAEVRDQLANAQGGRPLTPAPPAPMRRRKIGATVAACNNARSVRPV